MKKWKEILLIALVGLLSMLSILFNPTSTNIPRWIVSVVGLICLILYFVKKDKVTLFIKIWIIAQLPYIAHVTKTILTNGQEQPQLSNLANETNVMITQTVEQITISRIWDTAQILNFHLDLTLNNVYLGVNIFPLIFLGLYKFLKNKTKPLADRTLPR